MGLVLIGLLVLGIVGGGAASAQTAGATRNHGPDDAASRDHGAGHAANRDHGADHATH